MYIYIYIYIHIYMDIYGYIYKLLYIYTLYCIYIHILSTGLPGHIQGRKPHDHPRLARAEISRELINTRRRSTSS